MVPTLEVRKLSADEWEIERDLRLSALRDAPEAFGSTLAETILFDEGQWRERLVRQARFAAWIDGEPVGTAGCSLAHDPYPQGAMVLVGMWVRPAARSRGVACRLVGAVIECCLRHDRPEIWLSVTHGNVAAERLYAKHGFHRTGTDLEGDGDTFDMRRDGPLNRASPS